MKNAPQQKSEFRICLIGAGPGGLVASQVLKGHDIAYDHFEKSDDIGGIWQLGRPDSPAYRSVHLISSKKLAQFRTFPMPAHYPDFPGREELWKYLNEFASHYDLKSSIRFRTEVTRTQKKGDQWQVDWIDHSTGKPRTNTSQYDAIVVATGHEWFPTMPEVSGSFSGLQMHSAQYRVPETFLGKNVLIVGAGNSGCDIALDIAPHAKKAFWSLRRGYHFIPKYILGKPADQMEELFRRFHVPRWFRQWGLRFLNGKPENFGLPKPNHKVFETHPIMNSKILEALGHGVLTPKPDLASFDGNRVTFRDGTSEEIDAIIYATGYRPTYPFLEPGDLDVRNGHPNLYLHLFPRNHEDLAVIGMLKPDSGVWWLMELQAHLLVHYWLGLRDGQSRALRFREKKNGPHPDLSHGSSYVSSARHFNEVEHRRYGKLLERECLNLQGQRPCTHHKITRTA